MKRAFTLIELLVVVGIIAILLAIVIPVVGKVRQSARVASVQAQLNALSGAIESYRRDHAAYPGPLANNDIWRTGFTDVETMSSPPADYATNMGPPNSYQITGTENLVLGLLGGLAVETGGKVVYNPTFVGTGAMHLSFAQPKKFPAYLEATNLSWRTEGNLKTGNYKDNAGDGRDSIIPEFVDTFPNAMPILYLRARKGAVAQESVKPFDGTYNPVITNVPQPTPPTSDRGHYDVNQIIGYTGPDIAGNFIGEEKDIAVGDYTTPPASGGKLPHGLVSVTVGATGNPASTASLIEADPTGKVYVYPYDAYPYFKTPDSSDVNPQPRSKDSFILISAGADRVYGTSDDIASFGAVNE